MDGMYGQFERRKVPVEVLSRGIFRDIFRDSPLKEPLELPNTIRYFYFSANNIEWIEV